MRCPALASCVDGACACDGGLAACGDACLPIDTVDNCGGCGIACPTSGGWACDGGFCGCEEGLQTCDGTNCRNALALGACGDACVACEGAARCSAQGCQAPRETDLRLGPDDTLEVFRLGEWATVCGGEAFDDVAGEVACRQLGGTLLSVENARSSTNLTTAFANVQCTGTEDRLAGCARTAWATDACDPRTEAVSVRCAFDAPAPCEPIPSDAVRINEVMANPVGLDEAPVDARFVELFGAADTAMTGASIELLDVRGNVLGVWDLSDLVIPADGYLVIGDPLVDNVDAVRTPSVPAGPASIRLLDCRGHVLDAVAFGGFDTSGAVGAWAGEGEPRDAVPAGKPIGRITGAPDTGDNAADFILWSIATPGLPNEASVQPNTFPQSIAGRLTVVESLYPPNAGCVSATVSPYRRATLRFTNTEATPVTVLGTAQLYTVTPGGWMEPPRTNYITPYFGAYSTEPNPANLLLGCEEFSTSMSGNVGTLTYTVPPGEDAWFVVFGRGEYNYSIRVEAAP